MSDDKKGGHDDHKEKSFGEKVVGILVKVGIAVLALQLVGPLLGFGGDGVVGAISSIGQTAHNVNVAATNAQREFLPMMQRFLQIGFAVATFVAFGFFLRFVMGKIKDAFAPAPPAKKPKAAAPAATPPAAPAAGVAPAAPHHPP